MTVKELKDRIDRLLMPNERGRSKLHPDTPVIIETEQGHKYHLLTAKNRTHRAGHKNTEIFWLPIGKKFNW